MTKAELIDFVSTESGISKSDATKAIKATFDAITETLKEGDSFTLVGFGTFSVSEQAAREGRNPQTGETIKIPARKVPKFKAGKQLKEVIAAT